MKLSVAIIAFNEEAHIARCLASVQRVADEVLVVDSFSTDKTPNICREMGARVVQRPFEGHIQQKNFALTETLYDWVLSLDADEALEETLIQEIEKIKVQPQTKGYVMRRLNNYCGHWIRHGTWYPDERIRLVNRNFAHWGGHNPHDRLIMDEGASLSHLRGHILHYTIDSLEAHVRQINYFSGLAAQAKFEAGKKFSWWRLITNPPWRFVKEFILKGGFLDGYWGFQIAVMASYSGFLRYAKLRELWRQHRGRIPRT